MEELGLEHCIDTCSPVVVEQETNRKIGKIREVVAVGTIRIVVEDWAVGIDTMAAAAGMVTADGMTRTAGRTIEVVREEAVM